MFEVKIAPEVAQLDVEALLDYQKKLPKKRKDLAQPIEQLVEAVSLGFVVIDDSTFEITQTLIEPIMDKSGNPAIEKVVYKPRPDPAIVSKRTQDLKAGSNQSTLLLMHASISSSLSVGELSKFREGDADIRDAIAALFL